MGRALGVALLGIVVFAAATLAADKDRQLIATMTLKPEHRWQVVLWLSQNSETVTPLLQAKVPKTAGHEFIWHHTAVERRTSRGAELVPGKTKVFVADVPFAKPKALWEAKDGRLVIGYRRRQLVIANATKDPEIIGVDTPRLRGDKPVYAETVRLLVDEDGHT